MAPTPPPETLRLEDVHAGYGDALILRGVDLDLARGEVLALMGRNGVGKTTLVNTVMGQTRMARGRVVLEGADITALRSHRRALAGLGWVPQERNIFASLSVEENLTAIARPGPWTPARVLETFPRLAERRRNYGTQLSGGEQQMLAVGRALATNPKVLLLDEPLEGLAPVIVAELVAALKRLAEDDGLSLVIVEQNARQMLDLADKAVILERGRVVHSGPSAALKADPATVERYLGLAAAPAATP